MWTRVDAAKPLALALGLLTACSAGCSREGDPPLEVGDPSPLGNTPPLHVLQDPSNPDRIELDPPPTCQTSFSAPITVQGVTVNWVDRYDETGEGAVGTVWIQDYASTAPWSGSSIFSPSFVPASLYVAPGDVLDLRGLYQVNVCIGANVNFQQRGGSNVLAQIATPVSTFRFEGAPSTPVDVPLEDFSSFETGRKWIGMLVRISDVSVVDEPTVTRNATTGRIIRFSAPLAFGPSIGLSNEFQELGYDVADRGKQFASVTGVVTWFFDFKLATRTPEDLVPAAAP